MKKLGLYLFMCSFLILSAHCAGEGDPNPGAGDAGTTSTTTTPGNTQVQENNNGSTINGWLFGDAGMNQNYNTDTCGAENQPCCNAPIVTQKCPDAPNLQCDLFQNKCLANQTTTCGGKNQDCCPNSPACSNSNLYCNFAEGKCRMHEDADTSVCGYANQTCCGSASGLPPCRNNPDLYCNTPTGKCLAN